MNFSIYMDRQMNDDLIKMAQLTKKSKNMIIREAIDAWIKNYTYSQWPETILEFQGMDEPIPSFESYRQDLPALKDSFVL